MSTLGELEQIDLADDADGYIRKPFRPKDVAEHVTAVLARKTR
jgi:DNA-binding response OmpR family regulator